MSSLSVTHEENQVLPDFGVPYGALPHQPYPVSKYQWRAVVQPFTSGGFEATIKLTDVEKVAQAAEAGMYGYVRGRRVASMSSDREGDIIKATQRAKRAVRLKCKEMGADRLLTLTTRETLEPDVILSVWQVFAPMVERAIGGKFFYLAVLEPHPTNPDHFHLHVAINVRLNVHILRKCWHAALTSRSAGVRGQSRGVLRGKASPGNVDIKRIKARGNGDARARVARYISKYITKDCLQRFNRKRYWSSKVTLLENRKIWLQSSNNHEAIAEFMSLLGFDGYDLRDSAKRGNIFIAPNRELVWFNHVAGDGEPAHGSLPF